MKTLVVATTVLLLLSGSAMADRKKDAPTTPATEHHGLPGNNPSNAGGASANPNGQGAGGGNGIHDIDQNPGQSGNHPDPSGTATQPAENMHGGLDVGPGHGPNGRVN